MVKEAISPKRIGLAMLENADKDTFLIRIGAEVVRHKT